MYSYMRVLPHIHKYISIYVCIHTPALSYWVFMCLDIHICVCTYIYMYKYTYVYICTCAVYVYIYIFICM